MRSLKLCSGVDTLCSGEDGRSVRPTSPPPRAVSISRPADGCHQSDSRFLLERHIVVRQGLRFLRHQLPEIFQSTGLISAAAPAAVVGLVRAIRRAALRSTGQADLFARCRPEGGALGHGGVPAMDASSPAH
jgi:hypothetical protein